MGAQVAQKKFAHIPVCTIKQLADADAIIFGNLHVLAICVTRSASSLMPHEASGKPEPL